MSITTRAAHELDLAAVRSLLGQLHEDRLEVAWSTALWGDIVGDPNRTILLAEAHEEEPVGTADVLIVPNLTHAGAAWAVVENVVVHHEWRRRGVGTALVRHALRIARSAGCHKIQLTSSIHRTHAHRFYEQAGFQPEAIGYRYYLPRTQESGAA